MRLVLACAARRARLGGAALAVPGRRGLPGRVAAGAVELPAAAAASRAAGRLRARADRLLPAAAQAVAADPARGAAAAGADMPASSTGRPPLMKTGSAPRRPKETAALWAAHRERLARLISRLKPSWPAPRTDRKDPYAIRAALAACRGRRDCWRPAAMAAIVCAPPSRPPRPSTPALLRLDAWVTPPRLYRHRADRACRRQRDGRRGRRDPSARCRCRSGAS